MKPTYDIIELQKMSRLELVEIAKEYNIHVLTDEAAGKLWGKQNIIYQILDEQACSKMEKKETPKPDLNHESKSYSTKKINQSR